MAKKKTMEDQKVHTRFSYYEDVKSGQRYKKTMKKKDRIYGRWMPYEAARLTVQTVSSITSRGSYWKWHEDVQPFYIPKFPHRVYKEWQGWNHFLGNDNTWDGWDRQKNQYSWMPYWDAARCVQKLNLTCKSDYMEAYEEGKIPSNIPKAPDQTYKESWMGWNSFLGKDIIHKMESVSKIEGIVCLCTYKSMPSNVMEVVVAPNGRSQMQSKLTARDDLIVVKSYVWEPQLWDDVQRILRTYGSEQVENQFIFPNVNVIFYELDNILLWYRW